jgi:S1-C subfamily serine protease
MTRALLALPLALAAPACLDLALEPSAAAPAPTTSPAPPDAALVTSTPSATEAPGPAPSPASVTPEVPPPSPSAYIEDERNTMAVFEAASRATVFVTQRQVVRDFSRGLVEVPRGSGTGFLWDDRGHVVTNYHVVDGARALSVTLADGSELPATFVGGEPRKDIAVLRIDAPADKLVAIRLPPEGHELRVGQKAVAIGNPFGLDNTLTVGVISALGRDVEGYGGVTIRDMVQTDASINPGNSGGPLLDSQGRLIGMNTMIFSRSGSSAGIGFAVPVSTIQRVVSQIVEFGKPLNVGLGVTLLQDAQARRLGIRGVILRDVAEGSPAERAGLTGLRPTPRGVAVGDVIVGIDGQEIARYDDLYQALDARSPGDVVAVRLLRDGQTREVDIEVALLP